MYNICMFAYPLFMIYRQFFSHESDFSSNSDNSSNNNNNNDSSSNNPKQITIKDKEGRAILYDIDKVDVTSLEEDFRLVRIHLEGSDHSAKFPDKYSGRFEHLHPSGHGYNKEEAWKSEAAGNRGRSRYVVVVVVVRLDWIGLDE